MAVIYGGTFTLPTPEKLKVGDEVALGVRRVGSEDDAVSVSVILAVEDIYEAAPGVTDVAWVLSHPFKCARCEVEYDPRTGVTDITIYVDEE